jgi:NAD(P)H-hydrate repair Nnr-like enzyme with NAD(P)H-hydrate dehydratase domain
VTTTGEADEALAHASDADVIIDAIFGTGLNRAPEGVFADVISAIAELRLPVIAVDVPSGANASSAEPFDPCVQAEVTVTFAVPKVCHIFEPAATYCGEVIVADISIPHAAIDDEMVSLSLITPRDMQPLFPARLAETHKGTYGHVALLAGSPGRSGAALMAARGAMRAGAGLVSVMTDRDTALLIHAGSAEAMTYSGNDVREFLRNKSAVVAGPGLPDDGTLVHGGARHLRRDRAASHHRRVGSERVRRPRGGDQSARPAARDHAASGRAGAADRRRHGEHQRRSRRRRSRRREEVQLRRRAQGTPDARRRSIGRSVVNPTGNPGMATGGMGDVLAGIVGAMLAREHDPIDAARAAVYLHGLAGDILKDEIGDTGLLATEVADRIPHAIQRVRGT